MCHRRRHARCATIGSSLTITRPGRSSLMTTVFTLVLLALAAEAPARFEAAADGTVRDAKTALVWTQKDNGADVDLAAATAYCDGLSLAGKDDWRLATIDE